MKLYTGQPIEIELQITVDGSAMTTGQSAVINYRKPGGTIGSWTATVDNIDGTVNYSALSTEIDQDGKWKLQPVVTFIGGNAIPGESLDMTIAPRFT